MNSLSRSSFLKTAGIAAGSVAVAASPAVAAAGDRAPVETTSAVPLPHRPVVAILRDARRGEVTVLVGTTEKTYRDRRLADRLLRAARQNLLRPGVEGVA